MTEEQLAAAENTGHSSLSGAYLGFMSGTSMDGVDAALLATDGLTVMEAGPFLSASYDNDLRDRIRGVLGAPDLDRDGKVAEDLTKAHVALARRLLESEAAKQFLAQFPLRAIGFHGQTVFHDPKRGITTQIGQPELLHVALSVPVVHDFRTEDVAAGGQGAPLAPIYHHALCRNLQKPVAVLNLGGVANLTWIPSDSPEDMLAFDCGPGNGLIDDWVSRHTSQSFDLDGGYAAAGEISTPHVQKFMNDPFFQHSLPKSLDRMAWSADCVSDLSLEDGAATLTAMTVEPVCTGLELLPGVPHQLIVCGGGRKNATLMTMLQQRVGPQVSACEQIGWNGDAVEAEAFAFMAARRLRGLSSTFPGTTGVPTPMTAGQFLAN